MSLLAWMNPGVALAGDPASPVPRPAGYDPKVACERYAREDGIQPNHLVDYINQCLRDLANDQMHAEEESDPAFNEAEADALLNPPASPKPPDPVKPSAWAKPPATGKPPAPARPKQP
ncbi:MAG: hypothetical protein HQL97_11385 [Magnetococcales bacterium]|nr:hypothetical protein [Magnetococcales bacterium]